MKVMEHRQLAALQGLTMCVEAFDTLLEDLDRLVADLPDNDAPMYVRDAIEVVEDNRKVYKRALKRLEKKWAK